MWTCYQTALHAHLQYCSCPLSAVDNILELDFQTNGSVRPQLEWASKHTNLIDKLEMDLKTDQGSKGQHLDASDQGSKGQHLDAQRK